MAEFRPDGPAFVKIFRFFITVGKHCSATISAKPAMWGVNTTFGADHIGSSSLKHCTNASSIVISFWAPQSVVTYLFFARILVA